MAVFVFALAESYKSWNGIVKMLDWLSGEKMKFRVVSDLFVETSPVQCPDNPELPDTINTEPKVPYSITVSLIIYTVQEFALY